MPGEGGGSEGTPANSGSEGGAQATLFTQEQVNTIAAREKRGAVGTYFKELGFDTVPDAETIKQTFQHAGEYKKQQDGQKGDVERLGSELSAEKEKSAKVPTLETTILRQQIAGAEQLPVRFWKFVEGKTDDEIKESVEGLKKDLNLEPDDGNGDGEGQGNGQQQQATGTGARPPNPNQQQGRTNGGGSPATTLTAGRAAYEAKHGKKKE